MRLTAADLALLRCPTCRAPLLERGPGLACTACREEWPVVHGLPVLYREAWVRGPDRLMRHFYDNLPRLHDPAVHYLLPIWQLEGTEPAMRDGYIRRLELGQAPAGQVLRVLEVSIGTGVNVELVQRALPPGVACEYWGLDLSTGMLRVCRDRLAKSGRRDVRLLQGDAHALPFADGSFDRVFHVGGIGGFSNPGKALAEMARVARPGTPIVVVDEELEKGRRHGLWPRLWFAALTFYDRHPHCPSEALPAQAWDVLAEPVSRFYYCLRFRVGGAQP